MWNYIVQIIGQKRGQHIEGAPSPEEQQQDPRAGIGNERKQFHKTMGPEDIGSADMLMDTESMKQAGSSYAGGEAGAAGAAADGASVAHAAELAHTAEASQASALPAGAAGAFGMESAGGSPQSPPPAPVNQISNQIRVEPARVDVFGGEDFGAAARTAGAKIDPAVSDYIQERNLPEKPPAATAQAAQPNFWDYAIEAAKNKWGGKIAGGLDFGALVASGFGADDAAAKMSGYAKQVRPPAQEAPMRAISRKLASAAEDEKKKKEREKQLAESYVR